MRQGISAKDHFFSSCGNRFIVVGALVVDDIECFFKRFDPVFNLFLLLPEELAALFKSRISLPHPFRKEPDLINRESGLFEALNNLN